MKDFSQTLNLIKERGFYYIEFRPTNFDKELIPDLKTVREFMNTSKVSLRGWPFPLIPSSNKDFSKIYNGNDRVESWVCTDHYLEVWRLYKSGLFVDYSAINEDWYGESGFVQDSPLSKIQPNTVLDLLGVIYEVTEMILFIGRLAEKMQEVDEFYLRFIISNLNNRQLVLLDPSRVPLSGNYTCFNDKVEYEKVVKRDEIVANTHEISKAILQEIFEQFNWEGASEKLIVSEQEKLISRKL